ncbi:MAG TPA: Ig-like domain-containing protein, partial [Candidatus Paceibacterota bacterium]|nr:Ig-like domain-containing protein [Candidatus Paceibacterota bacterium]
GYKNFKYCDGPKRADGSCDPRYEKTGTPGQIIEESINQRLNSPQHRLEIADEFDELVSALVNQLIKTAISEVLSIGSNDSGSGSVRNNTTVDSTKPAVSITAPANNSSVSGTIAITATSTDNVGVTSVQFRLNGGNLQVADTSAPYSVSLNTMTIPNGTHTITAISRDAAGNTQTSAPVKITVNNVDATPPTVSITAPASGTASGTILISASASDNNAIYGVQFKLNGANLQSEDTFPSYSINWDSKTVSNGSYQILAVARDMAGNRATSSPVTLTISNTNP